MTDYGENAAIAAQYDAAEDEAYEEYQIRRDALKEEMWYARAMEREAEDREEIEWLARTCPECEGWCDEADYAPADESVGIFGGVYCAECPEHGIFYTYEDKTQELE